MACICSKSYGYSIEKCMQMEVIIRARKLGEVPEMMADLNPFAKLQYLRLRVLPKLKSVNWNESPFPHVREIIESECPIRKKLSLGFNNAKESKIVIRGQEHWWNELQRKDEATVNAFFLVSVPFDRHQHGFIFCGGQLVVSAFPFITCLYLTFVFLYG